jgi:hypothetical protein
MCLVETATNATIRRGRSRVRTISRDAV